MSKKPTRRDYISFSQKSVGNYVLLDSLNINIIKELVDNPEVKSSVIASKYSIPLSTIQRRRAALERSILKKTYSLDMGRLGWREADLMVAVEKGDGEAVAKKFLDGYGNVASTSLRIGDPNVNVMAHAFYKTSQDLQTLVEAMRRTPSVKSVEWSEVVKLVGSRNSQLISTLLNLKG